MSHIERVQIPAITDNDATTLTSNADEILVPNSQNSETIASSTHSHISDPQLPSTDVSQSAAGDTDMSSQSESQYNQTQLPIESLKPGPADKIQRRPSTISMDLNIRQDHDDDRGSSPSSGSSRSSSHGSKRTFSGTIKNSIASVIGSPDNVRSDKYAEKKEGGSTGIRISELSLQLKTNLKYAMIKVQNGWEQRSIDEVESLAASQLSSPVSTTSTMFRGSMQSPRLAMAGMTGRSGNRDSLQSNYRSADLSRPGTAGSAWSHPLSTSPELYDRHPVVAKVPSLAPAPDLHPMSRHHRTESKHSRSAVHNSVRATTPTPQEQDAVDTLLFMSSPANSSRFAHSQTPASNSAQHSPSRSQFAMPRRNLGLGSGPPPRLGNRASASSEEEVFLSSKRGMTAADVERQAKRRSFGLLKNDSDVDKLLDQIGDAASSEEENPGRARLRGGETVGLDGVRI